VIVRVKKMMPPTRHPGLLGCIFVLAAGMTWMAGQLVGRALSQGLSWWPLWFVAALLLALVAGLWRMRPWARTWVVVGLWCLLVILPLGILNPFWAMDQLGPLPGAGSLMYRLVPWMLMGLFALHVLGRHKRAFHDEDGF